MNQAANGITVAWQTILKISRPSRIIWAQHMDTPLSLLLVTPVVRWSLLDGFRQRRMVETFRLLSTYQAGTGWLWVFRHSPKKKRLRSYISISEGYGYCTPLQILVYLLTTSGRAESPLVVSWQKDFAKQGYSTWNTTVARRQFSATVTPEDVQKFSEWDTSFVWEKFPKETDVLTIHGLSDELVPP